MRKNVILAVFFVFICFSISGCDFDRPKYSKNDCITALDSNNPIFNGYAKVIYFSGAVGRDGKKNYILSFSENPHPNQMVSQDIEKFTKRVARSNCH